MTPADIDRLCERIAEQSSNVGRVALAEAVRAALEGERERVEALRRGCVRHGLCGLCKLPWQPDDPESHGPGCLAAPETP